MHTSSSKHYFPWLDLLKFLCCVGVVSIHTKPFLYCDTTACGIGMIQFLPGMSVPIFFMVSAFLFWGKITFNFKEDSCVIKRFVSRLAILYVSWSILISPVWFTAFYRKYPEEWMYLLPFKFFVTGAAHGSWFIMSLIQGIVLCYVLNKFLGKMITTILCFAVTFYVNLVFYGMPDYLNIYYNYKVFNIWFSPFYAMLWIQLGCLVRLFLGWSQVAKCSMKYVWIMAFVGLIVSYTLREVQYVNFIANALFYCLVLCFCATPVKKNRDFSMLRKMSIIIYFSHFAFTVLYRALVWKGYLSYEYGFREFAVVLSCSIVGSYLIVKLSEKIKFLKCLY